MASSSTSSTASFNVVDGIKSCLEKSKIAIKVGESTTKVYLCDFNGGCGQKFQTSTDLLDHVAVHLDEQTVIIKLNNDPPKGQGNEEGDLDLASYEMDFKMCFSEQEVAEVLGSSFEFDESAEMEDSEAGLERADSSNAGGDEKSDGRTWVKMEDILNETASSSGEELRAADDQINWDEFFESFSPDLKLSLSDSDTELEDSCCEPSMDLFFHDDSEAEDVFEEAEELLHEAELKTEHVERVETYLAGPKDAVIKVKGCGGAQKVPKKKSAGQKTKAKVSKKSRGVLYKAEDILATGLIKRKTSLLSKPYVCPVPGCSKSYKNPNGIKYHAKYGHSAPQEFYCTCGKIYSTRHGLMAHVRQRREEKCGVFEWTGSEALQED